MCWTICSSLLMFVDFTRPPVWHSHFGIPRSVLLQSNRRRSHLLIMYSPLNRFCFKTFTWYGRKSRKAASTACTRPSISASVWNGFLNPSLKDGRPGCLKQRFAHFQRAVMIHRKRGCSSETAKLWKTRWFGLLSLKVNTSCQTFPPFLKDAIDHRLRNFCQMPFIGDKTTANRPPRQTLE